MINRDDIEYQLTKLNDKLTYYGLHLDLTIVGGSALILNGINAIETEDIDTITRMTEEVKDIIDDLSLDINNDALDYIHNYMNKEFIDSDLSMSNISVSYLNLPGVLITKMDYVDDPDKTLNLYYLFKQTFGIEMSIRGIEDFLDGYGYICSIEDKQSIATFLNTCREYGYM